MTRCININCPAQVKGNIKHFAAKGAFDIDGLGDKLIDQLVDKNLIQSYADLFDLTVDVLKDLDRMGKNPPKILWMPSKRAKPSVSPGFYTGWGFGMWGSISPV
ncbi:MAG: hypothetical protein R2860_02995 [Desulfobacterales bacterium]